MGDGIFEKSHIFTGFMDANQWSLRLIAALLTKIEFQEKYLKPWGEKKKENFACQQILTLIK